MQAYSDPERENDPHALPNIEVFYVDKNEFLFATVDSWEHDAQQTAIMDSWADENTGAAERDAAKMLAGWYWHSCFPGCLPDSDPIGPFETEQAALKDAQNF